MSRLVKNVLRVRCYVPSAQTQTTLLCICFLICAWALSAQEGVPTGFELWNSKILSPVRNDLVQEAPKDPHRFAVRQLADYVNDSFLLVHRAGDGQVEWHETQADVFFVQSGTATLVLGGHMVNAETVGPHEKRNGTIEGGIRRPLAAGDIVRIPPRIPHQILLNGAPEFNYFVVKVKGY
jgi:mannose-6-phosphate isomerase-like protein (cupin superfamily)